MNYLLLVTSLIVASTGTLFAWNPITDIRENIEWTIGKEAQVGTAIKIGGAGDLDSGETTTSLLAGIANYRFMTFSYGGTRINKANSNFTDTAKLGLRLTKFFDWFKNPPTPEMELLRNVNIGPSYSIPLLSSPRNGALFLDLNYTFGGS